MIQPRWNAVFGAVHPAVKRKMFGRNLIQRHWQKLSPLI